MAFAKLKTLLRKATARTRDSLWDAIAQVRGAFTPTNAPPISPTPDTLRLKWEVLFLVDDKWNDQKNMVCFVAHPLATA
jgi:hypothetical protein